MKLALVSRPPSPSTLHQRRGGLSLPQHYIRGGGEASLSLNTTSEEGRGRGRPVVYWCMVLDLWEERLHVW